MKTLLRKLTLVFAIVVTAVTVMGYSSDHQKVYDEAGILSAPQTDLLNDYAKRKGDSAKLDIVIWTIDEYMSGTSQTIADDKYDSESFGYNDCDGSGTIFLIDMYSREIYISTSGLAILYMDDDCIDETLDDIYLYMQDNDYYGACRAYIDDVYKAYENHSSIYDESIEKWYNGEYENYDEFYADNEKSWDNAEKWPSVILCSLGAGLVIALIVVLGMYYKQRTSMDANSKTYLVSGSVDYLVRNDAYINTTTTSRKIETSSGGSGGGHGGSTHHSSSGHSHGGGGRSF